MKWKMIYIFLLSLILTGCSQSMRESNIIWSSEYDLEVDYYKVGVKRTGPDIEDYIEIVNVVDNQSDIETINHAFDSSKWIIPDDRFSEEPILFLIINDNTIVQLYGGDNHAQIMNYSFKIDQINTWTNVSEIFVLNDDIYSIVKGLSGEY